MKLSFLGGAGEVGRVGLVLEEAGSSVLLDYGFTPSKPPSFPAPCPKLDDMFLSHGHMDHCGMIPFVTGRYKTKVNATTLSRETAELLLRDSANIARAEGAQPPYPRDDLLNARASFVPRKLEQTFSTGPWEARLLNAGHIPGSAMVHLRGERDVLFTGDMNSRDSFLMQGCAPVSVSTLFMEGTYAGREHPPREEVAASLVDKIDEVVARGGTAVVPVFAVGRFQEVLLILCDQGFDVWVDGMGRAVSRMYLDEPDSLRDAGRLRRALSQTTDVVNTAGRRRAHEHEVLVTTSGMLEGGPVLDYLFKLRDDPKNAVLMTGYQVENTNGRLLLDTGNIRYRGITGKVSCEVAQFDLSGHAGHSELIEFARACKPDDIVLFHSDDRASLARDLDGIRVHTPENGQVLEL